MLKFTLTPYDVLFFGNSKPFDRGSDATSIFPPLPNSFASTIFAKMYHLKDVKHNREKPLINAVYGPFIEKSGQIYFPAPHDILSDGKEIKSLNILTELEDSLIDIHNTDIGNNISSLLWLVGDSDKNIKPFEGYISLEGLQKWLIVKKIDKNDPLNPEDIYEKEERLCINIEHNKGTTKEENGLFRVSFIRLKKYINFIFWIDFKLDNLKLSFENENKILEFYNKKPRILKAGGEDKALFYECCIDDFNKMFDYLKVENNKKNNLCEILFLTQGILNNEGNDENILGKLPGFKTGVFSKYIMAGINSKNLGTKIVRAIPAGSIFYSDSANIDQNPGFLFQNADFIGSNLILKRNI
jgi:CRISPR-associated protein Cmr3